MLVMIKTDFVTMKNYALQLLGIMLLVSVFICLGTGSFVAGIAALTVMLPFMYIFSIVAYDEMNGWERFRLTLPISRNQVVLGRYASILIVIALSIVLSLLVAGIICLAAMLLPQLEVIASFLEGLSLTTEVGHALLIAAILVFITALVMPLFMRFGMTKATRIAPLVFLLLALAVIMFVGDFGDTFAQSATFWEFLLDPTPDQAPQSLLLCALIFAVMLVPYGISAFVATRLYAKRQF